MSLVCQIATECTACLKSLSDLDVSYHIVRQWIVARKCCILRLFPCHGPHVWLGITQRATADVVQENSSWINTLKTVSLLKNRSVQFS